jgi:NDP-sugar pyrophosphorylase family protein
VVLAAGKGTRLRPLTDNKPKVLAEVKGTPLIEDAFDNLIDAGETELVVVGYKAGSIISNIDVHDYFQDRSQHECEATSMAVAH